uniref:Aldo-keto reductase n=1 Tax=Riptortus pedestris TaxID=329032 RepID=R4WIG7_RIPPE|nr:aldo-keto reductase [Riptortus pedestris]
MAASLTPSSVLVSGQMRMPVIGLGTWQATPEEIDIALNAAIDAGYRHIDTAFVYVNETAIGDSLRKIFASGKVERKDLFIVTKLPSFANRPEYVEVYIKKSLEALQLDYIDLYLIHNPVGFEHKNGSIFRKNENGEFELDYEVNHIELWKAMEAQVDAGRAKSIGVSNFNLRQVKRLLENSRIPPANNQVELHVYLQQEKLVSFCRENNVIICAYAPLGSPKLISFTQKLGFSTEGMREISPMTDPVIVEIAKKHNKLPSQVLLRYLVQYGVAVIPKSSNPERIKQNIEIFDFELSSEEMEKIKKLDKGKEGRMFAEKGLFASMKKHPEYPFND